MGKIINDGFTFMKYVNEGLIHKVDDIPALKHELIMRSETKTHIQMSQYAQLLANHILEVSGAERCPEMEACITINKKWQAGEVRFQAARDAAGVMNDLAREEKDLIRVKVLRALAQVAATPHVRWHALAASEFAVVIINLLFPGDYDKVAQERHYQIALMNQL